MGRTGEECTWCGAAVEPSDGYRLIERPGDRRAVFCRLEHVVPWVLQGPHWAPGDGEETGEVDSGGAAADAGECAHCGAPLGDVHLTLTRHRGEHRIPDAFCSVDHAAAWARAGGRWR
jgi:hypothetical protein